MLYLFAFFRTSCQKTGSHFSATSFKFVISLFCERKQPLDDKSAGK
ncbi:hypothetical protein CEV33_2122 [Brucella grignonensis]|uniref:Uncharacterized protein n=1 Tax=Brucella grignonensis TaxID=94627 RepID=A0A256F720_9HYPH|nr:hypothetical protein CEV33_2122 [Brucella grignonensis]